MKKLIHIFFFIFIFGAFGSNANAETKKDCSQYSTKNFADLTKYMRCKKGLKQLEGGFFDKLTLRGKKKEQLDPNIPCTDYSSKTFTGLLKKVKCKMAD